MTGGCAVAAAGALSVERHGGERVAGEGATRRWPIVRAQGKRSNSGGISRSAMRPSPRGGAGATDQRRGAARGLAEDELRGRCQLVRHGANGRLHDAAVGIGLAAQVLERRDPAHADRDVDDAPAPRPPEAVRDDHRDVGAEPLAQPASDGVRRGVGVLRQQRHDVARSRSDVGGIDAAVGADEAVRGHGDDDATVHADDAPRLLEHHLHLARIAVPARPELDGLGARDDRAQVDDRALRLGDDLLGHDEDVVCAERERPRACVPAASTRIAGRSSPGWISGMPSSATTSTRAPEPASAGTDHLGRELLEQEQVVGRVEVDRQRRLELRRTARRRRRRPRHGRRGESPPNANAIGSRAGRSSSAFVPRPWRSGTRATRARARRRRPPAAPRAPRARPAAGRSGGRARRSRRRRPRRRGPRRARR